MEGLAYNAQKVEDYPDRYRSRRETEIERRRESGMPLDVSYDELQELLDPLYRNYTCADGRLIYVVAGSHKTHPERVLKVLGIWEQLIAEGLPRHDPYLDVAEWPDDADCTLTNYPLSVRWGQRVSELMKQAFLARPALEWERIFGEAGAPADAQRTTRQWLASAHARQSGLVLEVDDPEYGVMSQLGNVAWLGSDTEAACRKEARRNVEAGDITAEPRTAVSIPTPLGGGWLDGLKVLDLTNVIAGPTIASTMARFGADVISIDPVAPTMDPWNAIVFGMHAGRGKRSLLMDLKNGEGRVAFGRLLEWADVITTNATAGQLASIGLDPERFRAVHPDKILCQLDCYGGPGRGPRSDYLGYDDLVQASTGVMARFGGSPDTPEEHAHFGTIDVLGGLCGVLAVGAALVQRGRTGAGDVARTSLCAAGQLIQTPFMYDHTGRGPFDEPSGREVRGWGPMYRAYQASDGWLFLAARDERITDLTALLGLNAQGLSGKDLETRLAVAFSSESTAHWLSVLNTVDIGAHRIDRMHEVRERNLVCESVEEPDLVAPTFAFIRHDQHPSGRWVDLVAPNAVRPCEASIRVPRPMPKPGAHSREALREAGFSADEIEAMVSIGLVAEEWCSKYLPE